VKCVLAEIVPSDDLGQVPEFEEDIRFALAASMDLAIAASMGRTYSDTGLLFFMELLQIYRLPDESTFVVTLKNGVL